jgi:predicted metal-dependent hydrolase
VQIEMGELLIDVTFKRMKSMHIVIRPPDGQVRVSAPLHVSLSRVRDFVASRLVWILQARERCQQNQPKHEYVSFETHPVWGESHSLLVIARDRAPAVELGASQIKLFVRRGAPKKSRQKTLEQWYARLTREEIGHLLKKWEPILNVSVAKVCVQQMKTRWGTCRPSTRVIRLNSDLAKRPKKFLDYVVLHELVHFFELSHGPRFQALMSKYLPEWRTLRAELKGRISR